LRGRRRGDSAPPTEVIAARKGLNVPADKTRQALVNRQLATATEQLWGLNILRNNEVLLADNSGPARAPWRLVIQDGNRQTPLMVNGHYADMLAAIRAVCVLAERGWQIQAKGED
jgi:hypothetical protein